MRERILAVAGAVALVVVAVVVRLTVFGGDGGEAGGGRSGGSVPVVACSPDLAMICADLAGAGVIARDTPVLDLPGAAEPDPRVDAWITWDAAPDLVDIDQPATWDDATALGSAPLGVVAVDGGIPAACSPPVTWTCLAEAWAGGQVAVGVGSARTSGGLARIEPLARALVPDDGDFTQITGARLAAIVTSPADGQDGLEEQVTRLLTARGALSALVGPLPRLQRAATQGGPRFRAVAVTPTSTITAVVATRHGHRVDHGRLASALARTTTLSDLGLTPGGTVRGADLAGDLYQVRLKAGSP